MRIRSFIIAYALVLAILLFADRRPGSMQQDRYSHVVDLTDGEVAGNHTVSRESSRESWKASGTHIIAPGALIPGTWNAGQIPAERLVAPMIVMDLNTSTQNPQISLDDISAWETLHGMIPQGAVVAIRRAGVLPNSSSPNSNTFPVARDAAQCLIDARYTIGFAVETPVDLTLDRTLARQIALHGTYVVAQTAPLGSVPATGSLVIVAPAKEKKAGEGRVRVLAMVR